MSVGDALRCPQCGDDSSIAKVSGVHRGQRSELARLLRQPSPDVYYDSIGNQEACVTIGLLVGTILGIILFLSFGALGGAIVLFIAGGLTGMIVNSVIESRVRSEGRKARLPEYTRKMHQWERAYYRQKHDLVFIPGDDWTGSPTDFRNLMS